MLRSVATGSVKAANCPRTRAGVPSWLVNSRRRSTPSSHVRHSPAMTIESRPRVGEDVLAQGSVVLRMCLLHPSPGFFRVLRDERLLPCHGHEPASSLGQELAPVGLQPVAVLPGALLL